MSGIAEASLAAGIISAGAAVMTLLKKRKKNVSVDKYQNDQNKRRIEEHDRPTNRLKRRQKSAPQTSYPNSHSHTNHRMLNDNHCIVSTDKLVLTNPYGYSIEATDLSYRKC